MKKSTSITIVIFVICINISVNANCFLDTYFKKSNVAGREMELVFSDFGLRYKINMDHQEKISGYGEKIILKENTSIQLVSRDNSLVISSIKKDIIDELKDIDVKNLNLLANYAFLAKESIDLRPIGKDVVKKTFLIFVTDKLPEQAKEVLSSLKENEQFTVICVHKKMMIVEYRKNSPNIKNDERNF